MTALEQARKVADAVLYEGYLLYPYRASAAKNQVRWQFGVLVPPAWAGTGCGEPTGSQAECVLEPGSDGVLHVVLRFLQVQSRTMERSDPDGFQPVGTLSVDGEELLSYDEAEPQEVDAVLPVALLRAGEQLVPVRIPEGEQAEPVHDAAGHLVGRTVRRRWPLTATLRVWMTPLPGPYGAVRLTVRVDNVSQWSTIEAGRDAALHHSLISAHVLFGISEGKFLSMIDPPEWARGEVEACHNEHCWPVLIGEDGRRDVMLASPIILYDYPTIAPESPGDLFDATEIDEILLLRTMTLTEEEKREARATDRRAAAIVDRADNMPPEVLDRLHGAVRYLRSVSGEPARLAKPDEPPTFRELVDADFEDSFDDDPAEPTAPEAPWWDPGADASVSPETDRIRIGAVSVGRGSRVRLVPGHRRADAQDLFLVGRSATVQAVFHDVDGEQHIAVTMDDDPLADLLDATGRYLYFAPDELEPWEESPAAEPSPLEGQQQREGSQ